MIIIYVNDMLVTGKTLIEELKTKVDEVFSIRTEDTLIDYLGCEFHTNKKYNKRMVGTATNYLKPGNKIWKRSNEDIFDLTPATRRFVAMRVMEDKDKLGTKNMQLT